MNKFTKPQMKIIDELFYGGLIVYDWRKGYTMYGPTSSRYGLVVRHTTISCLEDVLIKVVTDGGKVYLTLAHWMIEQVDSRFSRRYKRKRTQ